MITYYFFVDFDTKQNWIANAGPRPDGESWLDCLAWINKYNVKPGHTLVVTEVTPMGSTQKFIHSNKD